jgi:hypothetical protein
VNKTKLVLRTGFFIAIVGFTILMANVVGQKPDNLQSWNYSVGSNEMGAQVLISLSYGAHEIRLTAPRAFEGVLYILDYEGIEKLVADGTIAPMLNETFQGSTLIDFTVDRRGPYAVIVKSNAPNEAQVGANLLEKGTLRQDYIWDSLIIIAVGVIISILATTPRIGHLLRSKHKRNSASNSR